MNPVEFAAKIKEKYPQYADVPDQELVSKVVAKYPQYAEQIDMTPAEGGAVSPLPPGQDLANLDPEVAARVQRHRDILEMNELQRSGEFDRLREQGERQGAADAAIPSAMVLGTAPLGALGGAAGRFFASPAGDATVSGALTLAETGSPRSAAIAAAGGLVGGKVLGGRRGRGVVGRGFGMIRDMMRGKGDEVAEAAHRIATGAPPVSAAPARPPMPAPPGRPVATRGPMNTPNAPAMAPPPNLARAGSPGAQMQPTQTAGEALQLRPAGQARAATPLDPASIEKFIKESSSTHSRQWIIEKLKEMGVRQRGMAAGIVDVVLKGKR